MNRIQIGAHYTRSQHPNIREFRSASGLVNNLLWHMQPRKLTYENISVLGITVSDQGVENSREDPHIYRWLNGVVECQYHNFDFVAFSDLSVFDRNTAVLNLVRKSLSAVYTTDSDQLHTLILMTNKIEESNFNYEAESKKLSKSNKALKLSCILVARVDHNGQNAFLRVKNDSGEIISEVHLLTNNINEFRYNLHKTKWVGSQFHIYQKTGQLFKSFSF
ncbi:hypothetical protein FHS68_001381 [Dyadobacter arcticus]|uniref:Uncharacterized protein n=2 Tax=Dyadobacter arcticus TaxID=1078754 RepID=A0ABX0UKL8_9BACT|nr:hypothetical protein [Dyadobacter arcticus]